MSAPPKFAQLADAIAAYRAGRSRRWAEVDGWQIDLEQAAAEAGRVREEPAVIGVSADEAVMALVGRPAWDRMVGDSVAREFARASEVLPELAVPSEAARDVECCRECGDPSCRRDALLAGTELTPTPSEEAALIANARAATECEREGLLSRARYVVDAGPARAAIAKLHSVPADASAHRCPWCSRPWTSDDRQGDKR